jgi:hypothetical protein
MRTRRNRLTLALVTLALLLALAFGAVAPGGAAWAAASQRGTVAMWEGLEDRLMGPSNGGGSSGSGG